MEKNRLAKCHPHFHPHPPRTSFSQKVGDGRAPVRPCHQLFSYLWRQIPMLIMKTWLLRNSLYYRDVVLREEKLISSRKSKLRVCFKPGTDQYRLVIHFSQRMLIMCHSLPCQGLSGFPNEGPSYRICTSVLQVHFTLKFEIKVLYNKGLTLQKIWLWLFLSFTNFCKTN